MMLQQSMVLSFVCLMAFFVHQSSAVCDVCQQNNIACINETAFHLCYSDKADTSKAYSCSSGKVCTSLAIKCVDEGAIEPACSPNKNCGICDGEKMFTCTSRTTFVQCNGESATDVVGTCPEGLYCRSSGGDLCVSECNMGGEELECSNEAVAAN